ncbi:MAG: hypothetical protein ACI4EJ_04060 [Bacteroides sp.]
MNKKIKNILQFILAAGLSVPLYISVHELGHLIVMLSAGATIENFSVFTAHVTATGGNYTKAGELWLRANGAFLPVICAIVYLLFYKKDNKNSFYHFFSYVVALFPIGSMLAWVFIPFSYITGNAPINDDVTKFLNVFSQYHHPLIVSAVAGIIIGICIVIMVKKEIIRTVIKIVKKK